MSSLLDAILGNFNSGNSGSANLPPSGGSMAPNQAPELAADPYGNPVGGLAPGGLAPGVPLPRARPPEAGPALSPPGMTLPDMRLSESGGTLAAALGLDPDGAKTLMASLAGGLSNVKNSPFAGQVAANAAGGALAGGNKAEDTAIEQGIKLQRASQRGRYRGDMTDAKFGQPSINQQKTDQQAAYKYGGHAIGEQNANATAAIPRTEALVIDEETMKAAQADRDGTLAQARDAVTRDPSKRAAIIARLSQLGIAF